MEGTEGYVFLICGSCSLGEADGLGLTMPVATTHTGQSEVGCGQPGSHRVAVDAGDACDLVLVFLFGSNVSWENITNRFEAHSDF